jgi:hypothetical protein
VTIAAAGVYHIYQIWKMMKLNSLITVLIVIETRSMFISEKASEKLDTKHIQNFITEFKNWAFRDVDS